MKSAWSRTSLLASKFRCILFRQHGRRAAGKFRTPQQQSPRIHAGNLDNKDLVAGTTLYIPVPLARRAFEVGDGHAGQGDGEVDITALETSLIGTFQFVVRKDMHLRWPRAERPRISSPWASTKI